MSRSTTYSGRATGWQTRWLTRNGHNAVLAAEFPVQAVRSFTVWAIGYSFRFARVWIVSGILPQCAARASIHYHLKQEQGSYG